MYRSKLALICVIPILFCRQILVYRTSNYSFTFLPFMGRKLLAWNGETRSMDNNGSVPQSKRCHGASTTVICHPRNIYNVTVALSTTMYDSRLKTELFTNVVHNWAQFYPWLQPILFIAHEKDRQQMGKLIESACDQNWIVSMAPKIIPSGFVVLPDMVKTCMCLVSNAKYYGYANGDILFTKGLKPTLAALEIHGMDMITGRRFYKLVILLWYRPIIAPFCT